MDEGEEKTNRPSLQKSDHCDVFKSQNNNEQHSAHALYLTSTQIH